MSIAKRRTPPLATGHNLFLRSLSPQAYSAIAPHLEFVELATHQVLRKAGDPPSFIYFVSTGLISLVIETFDGKAAEIGLIGSEGLSGIPGGLRIPRNPMTEIVQVKGAAYRIDAVTLRRILNESAEVRDLVNLHVTVLAMRIAQIAGCNALHTAEQRLARWLLMVSDRLQMNPLPITQELLSVVLGITRPSVSATANGLREKGAINLRRKAVEILDREALERCSCECYRVIEGLKPR
jgi:CRP-like cAMP-binding protein